MSRVVRAALIQTSCNFPECHNPLELKQRMIEKNEALVRQAGEAKVHIVCLQELFAGPYFAAEQSDRWFQLAEPIDGPRGQGPTVSRFAALARELGIAIILPIMEEPLTGLYYNTAAVIDSSGHIVGKYRKTHLPQCHPGFWEKYYFRPGDLGYPVFDLGFAKIGLSICYDRHFPESARELGLAGAEIVFNPSATVAGLSEYLWKIEQPAHAVANQYFVGAINRVGLEPPWNIGEFYGQSYFCDPRGQIVAQAGRNQDELLVADLNLDLIREVRHTWQFYRDRRPETYSNR